MEQFFLFSSLLFACFPDTACHDTALDSANGDFSIIQHLFALDLLEKKREPFRRNVYWPSQCRKS